MDLMHAKKWFCVIFTVLIALTDWLYIFSLSSKSAYVTPLVIVVPFLIPLCLFTILFVSVGLYLLTWWGFFYSYILILASAFMAILCYVNIPHQTDLNLGYLLLLLFVNLLILAYLYSYKHQYVHTKRI